MLKEIQTCFRSEKILFTKHARDEMEEEKFGEIKESEVFEAVYPPDPDRWIDFERRKT